ncbi:MAG: hypothetical protein Q8910_07035 [Bacteroidota bacterium]|nr:hypothetical protein [Bacteroidota bacterium]
MKRLLLICILFFMQLCVMAQCMDVPGNCKLETKEDFDRQEPSVIKCIDWFLSTPIDEVGNNRNEVSSFIMKWISGTPTVTVVISDVLKPLMEEKGYPYSTDLIMVYVAGMAKFAIQNPGNDDKTKVQLFGIESMINSYSKISGKCKSKSMEKFISLQKKGQLELWVSNHL